MKKKINKYLILEAFLDNFNSIDRNNLKVLNEHPELRGKTFNIRDSRISAIDNADNNAVDRDSLNNYTPYGITDIGDTQLLDHTTGKLMIQSHDSGRIMTPAQRENEQLNGSFTFSR